MDSYKIHSPIGMIQVANKVLEKEAEHISIEEAKQLKKGTIVYSRAYENSDGTPRRYKVNGKPKTWKTMPNRVVVPLKRGLREYGHMTEDNIHLFTLNDENYG